MSNFYHVVVQTTQKNKKGNHEHVFWLDCESLDEIKEDVLKPYVNEDTIYIDGRYIKYNEIRSLKVKSSEVDIGRLTSEANRNVPPNVLMVYNKADIAKGERGLTDITKDLVKALRKTVEKVIKAVPESPKESNNKVFIVHGHDDLAKVEMARFIQQAGLEPIILHEQASSSRTIIEKIEAYGDVGFAVILYTPCDIGAKGSDKNNLKARARQNVVFEHGYFIGRLGRSNVSALLKDNVEAPNDISGVVYIGFDDRGAWKMDLAKELKAAGYNVDAGALF